MSSGDLDARAFGQLEGEVKALRRDVEGLTEALTVANEELRKVTHMLSEVRGGWRVLLLAGAAGGGLVVGLTKFVMFFAHLPGK